MVPKMKPPSWLSHLLNPWNVVLMSIGLGLSVGEVIAVIVMASSMVIMRLMRIMMMMLMMLMSMKGSFGEWSLNQFNVQSFV